jgi:hypothetical protein
MRTISSLPPTASTSPVLLDVAIFPLGLAQLPLVPLTHRAYFLSQKVLSSRLKSFWSLFDFNPPDYPLHFCSHFLPRFFVSSYPARNSAPCRILHPPPTSFPPVEFPAFIIPPLLRSYVLPPLIPFVHPSIRLPVLSHHPILSHAHKHSHSPHHFFPLCHHFGGVLRFFFAIFFLPLRFTLPYFALINSFLFI